MKIHGTRWTWNIWHAKTLQRHCKLLSNGSENTIAWHVDTCRAAHHAHAAMWVCMSFCYRSSFFQLRGCTSKSSRMRRLQTNVLKFPQVAFAWHGISIVRSSEDIHIFATCSSHG
jgi:hypothetical protein